jgi:hypothetical protein
MISLFCRRRRCWCHKGVSVEASVLPLLERLDPFPRGFIYLTHLGRGTLVSNFWRGLAWRGLDIGMLTCPQQHHRTSCHYFSFHVVLGAQLSLFTLTARCGRYRTGAPIGAQASCLWGHWAARPMRFAATMHVAWASRPRPSTGKMPVPRSTGTTTKSQFERLRHYTNKAVQRVG